MENMPNPNTIFPAPSIDTVTYVKPTVKSENVIVGDFTYFSGIDFEKHITHHYNFYGDKLIIGKFCQIASGVEFIMNGANHQMDTVSTFPFYIFEGREQSAPPLSAMPLKGDTVIGNDVWIGQNVPILPGSHIGDGVIVGANSTVGGTVGAYSIVAGNPARLIRKRFDDELIDLILKLKWWDLPTEHIKKLIPILIDSDLGVVKIKVQKLLEEQP
ncbi:MAG: CatB-related O-acetyltransferase [Oscillospiraceae bacterium]|jgi:virginiamycin A acetyltransferase|nr:CatB-related O-acetyltransferase [Oscillospiraceae bacterium]